MITQRTLQDWILGILPTFKTELQKLEEQMIFCGHADHHFLSAGFIRGGVHIFGMAPDTDLSDPKHTPHTGTFVPVDYIPNDHQLFVIPGERRPPVKMEDAVRDARGHETCPLCGKMFRVSLPKRLSSHDLVLVCCPAFKEGQIVVDALPIFSYTLMEEILSCTVNVPHQRSKVSMTRVTPLL